jgi:hypothetical protein
LVTVRVSLRDAMLKRLSNSIMTTPTPISCSGTPLLLLLPSLFSYYVLLYYHCHLHILFNFRVAAKVPRGRVDIEVLGRYSAIALAPIHPACSISNCTCAAARDSESEVLRGVKVVMLS